jgi:hypothetical protein
VSAISDVVSLGRIANVSSCVIGRALLDRRIDRRVDLDGRSAVRFAVE